MTRIYRHSIADAPEASRPLLEGYVSFSPTGKPLNLHAQMAHSPLVLAAYAAVRQATVTYGTLEPRVRSALMLATASVSHSPYASALTSFLAARSGWSPSEVRSVRDGHRLGDDKTDALIEVIREAASRSGRVSDAVWQQAADCGWTSEQLTEAFGYLALTVFTAYFLNYAQTPVDVETPGVAGEATAGEAAAGETAPAAAGEAPAGETAPAAAAPGTAAPAAAAPAAAAPAGAAPAAAAAPAVAAPAGSAAGPGGRE